MSNTNSKLERLTQKLQDGSATIGIVGLGYVGQPLALRFSEVGYRVLGVDISQERVDQLNSGHSSIEHIADVRVSAACEAGFEATTDFSRLTEADGIIICVPTPLNRHREPDLSFVVTTCEQIAPHLRPGQVVSLESTTYPGTTSEEVIPRMEGGGLTTGENIFVVYSPEREDPGNLNFTTSSIPKIVGGHTPACLKAGLALYDKAIATLVPVSSTETAELTKLLENIQRAVNIGLVNEMKIVADRMGIDIFEVIDAASTKPFGFTPYYPGPGLGGHCIPIDPFYLTWKAREYGLHTRFIELAGEVNRSMPDFVLGKLTSALNQRGKALNGAHIMVLGLSYKKNVDDVRESPAISLMELMRDQGAILSYADPHVPVFPKMRNHTFELTSSPLSPDTLKKQDALLLTTDHDKFDYELIRANAQLIVDTRGVYRDSDINVVRA